MKDKRIIPDFKKLRPEGWEKKSEYEWVQYAEYIFRRLLWGHDQESLMALTESDDPNYRRVVAALLQCRDDPEVEKPGFVA